VGLKEILKKSIEGTGEVSEALMKTAADIVKEGTHDTGDIFGAVIELGKEGVVDVTEGVKGVFIGMVRALEGSGKTTEEAIEEVSKKAVSVIGSTTEEGTEEVGEAARKGVEEAKKIVKEPFEK
jgi:putative cell wall-binding protein